MKGRCVLRNQEKDAAEMKARRERILETGFRLFSEQSIESVSMNTVAEACGVGIATLYRYFSTKLALVIAVGAWQWERYGEKMDARWSEAVGRLDASEAFALYLDGFLELYRNHRDLLRFNQYFNVYVTRVGATQEQLRPYLEVLGLFSRRFHTLYQKAETDGTLQTTLSERGLFTASLHLMLAAATRYAVGLLYLPEGGTDPEEELMLLRDMLLKEFQTKTKQKGTEETK